MQRADEMVLQLTSLRYRATRGEAVTKYRDPFSTEEEKMASWMKAQQGGGDDVHRGDTA